MPNAKLRYDVKHTHFTSQGERCAGTLYLPEAAGKTASKPPVVILGHGFAALREMRLPAFAERFAEAGIAAYFFDYRTFGDSDGEPRHWVDPQRHHQDWRAALSHVQGMPDIDSNRIALWGSSFGGGHVLTIAAERPEITAVIAQVPHVDGLATLKTLDKKALAQATAAGIVDVVRSKLGGKPHYTPVVGRPGDFAALNSAETWDGWFNIVPAGSQWENKVLSRVFLKLAAYSPIRNAQNIAVPTLIIAGSDDSITPCSAAEKTAKKIPRSEFHLLPCNHFQPYVGEYFEQNVALQLEFLEQQFRQPE